MAPGLSVLRAPAKPIPPWLGRTAAVGALTLLASAIAATPWVGLLSYDAGYGVVFLGSALAGILNLRAAWRWEGRERFAWVAAGSGGLLAGIGYLIGLGVEAFTGTFPVWMHAAFIGSYLAIGVGTLALPYQRGTRVEQLRLALDGAVGVAAALAIAWPFLAGVTGGRLVLDVDGWYLLADAFLLVAVVVLVVRRSAYRYDLRLGFLAAALLANLAGDLVAAADPQAQAAVVLWILAFASGCGVAWAHTRPVERRDVTDKAQSWWGVAAPYALAVMLVGLAVAGRAGVGFDPGIPDVALLGVATLVILRQSVAIRENRELVERERDALVSTVSHELRTPLTAISGFLQVLDDGWDEMAEEERRQIVGIAVGQSEHMQRMVGDLVQVARGRLSSEPLQRGPTDVELLVGEALQIAEVDAEVDIDGPIAAEVDADRIRQVLVNLLTNARRYGGETVRIVGRRSRNAVIVEVHDDGPGVPPRHQASIFDRFDRGPQNLLSTVPGSGLGLSIARALVDAHGGSISYRDSELEGGACFALRLPDRVGSGGGVSTQPVGLRQPDTADT